MTPRDKAIELIDKYIIMNTGFDYGNPYEYHKQCALIIIDEILEETFASESSIVRYNYWQEVKQEIEAL